MTKKVTNDTNCETSHISAIQLADLDEILKIERTNFHDPWERSFFETELTYESSICLKLCKQNKIISYIIIRPLVDEVHILNLATHSSHKRKGMARKLLKHAIDNLISGKLLLLEVRNSNEAARKLYEGFGFQVLYKRKGYYADGEDALVMIRKLNKVSDHEATLIKTEELSKDIISMWLEIKGLEFDPGQFLMLQVPGFPLRRPFVIADKDGNKIRTIFKLRGKGTATLKTLSVGTKLSVMAPLGNPFTMPEKGFTPLLVGGGIGIVTLLPLAKELSKGHDVRTLVGADTRDSLILSDEIKEHSQVITCTDDGTCGLKCNVVELTKKYIEKNKGRYCIYSCGPTPMLKELSRLAEEKKIKCYVSLEERMACGVGACLCCAVKTSDGIKRVCKDGPVFESTQVKWEGK